jgi:hypothetical protein
MPTIRRVLDPKDPAVKAFAEMQSEVYFEPDALIPLGAIRMMLSQAMSERSNILLVAQEENILLGGVLFHYLEKPNVGFSSFMGTTLAARGQGVGRRLHQARLAALDEVAGKPVEGVFLDSVAPERLTTEELEAEKHSGSDPFLRREIFRRFGFCKVDIRYEQPVGGPDGGPVTNMDLLFCPRETQKSILTALVVETMKAYWTPWLGLEAARKHAKELGQRANGERLELLSLL